MVTNYAEQCSDESSSVSMGICYEQLLLGQNLTTSTSDTDAEHNSEDEEEVYLEVAHTLNCEIRVTCELPIFLRQWLPVHTSGLS